jgi:glycosyltransferase involved in cell wall biosynthesis
MQQKTPRVLVLTPYLPWPATGACQQDRVAGIDSLRDLGYEVFVIAKTDKHHPSIVKEINARTSYTVLGVPYRRSQDLSLIERVWWTLKRIFSPLYLDGAAYEYTDPLYIDTVKNALETFSPDVVWVDYTYLWPLYPMIKSYGVRIVTRSANFEPLHYLEESGRGLYQHLFYIPKWLGERRAARFSDWMCAITPKEQERYKALGAERVSVLPLRALPRILAEEAHIDPPVDSLGRIHLFFAGSTYNVKHNRMALLFLLREIVPILRRRIPNGYVLHILGAKAPKKIVDMYEAQDVVFEGFVDNLDVFLRNMHVAVIPSLAGAGMQQKVFEPLTRGFPVVTHERAMAGYAFQNDSEVLYACSAKDFVDRIVQLRDTSLRRLLGRAARARASKLFSSQCISLIIKEALGANT